MSHDSCIFNIHCVRIFTSYDSYRLFTWKLVLVTFHGLTTQLVDNETVSHDSWIFNIHCVRIFMSYDSHRLCNNAVGQRIDNAVGQRIDSVGGQWDSESRLVNIQHTLCTNIHELWVNGNFHIKVGISQTSQTSLGLLLLSHFMLSELLPYYMDTVPILYRYCSYMRCDSWQGIGKVDVLWAWKKCLE